MAPAMELRKSQELARQAESAGLGGLFFTEGGRTAYLSCSAAGLATQEIRIGTAVALAFTRSPMVTAQIAWELADLTRGRFVLGLGTQVRAHIERRYGMEFSPPGPRMADYISAVKACFRAFMGSEELQYESRFYNLNLLTPQWNPGPIKNSTVPVYISAVLPYMSRLAGERADGIHIHPFHSLEYVRDIMLPEIQKGAEKAGRDMAEIELEIHAMTAAGDTSEEIEAARSHARTMIAFYGTTPAYAPVFEHSGFSNMTRNLRELQKAGKIDEMTALISDEVLEKYCITAGYGELADVLYQRYGALAPKIRIMSYSAINQWAKNPESLSKWGQIAKELRQK